MSCAPVTNARDNGRESDAEFAQRWRNAFVVHAQLCVREALKVRGREASGYEAGEAAGALAGAAEGVAAGVLAGVADVLVDELDESDVLGAALGVDAGVVLLEVDLLSVL